jgi:hypothetical protein
MSQAKHRLTALGLGLLAALMLTALWAAGAQAEAGATWKKNTVPITSAVEVNGELETGVNHPKLLTTFNGAAVSILCEKFKIEDGLLLTEGKSLGNLLFDECTTFINEVPEPQCDLVPHTGKTHEIEALVKDLIVLDKTVVGNPEGYDLFSPDNGTTTFVTLLYKKGTECILPAEIGITGESIVEDCNHAFRTEAAVHLIKEAPASLFSSTGLKFGKNPATIDGSINLFLVGGGNWSGTPG